MTTSLHRPTKGAGPLRPLRELDSFEIIPDPPTPPSGVLRSTWFRPRRRASRWARPYAAALVVLDAVAAILASATVAAMVDTANAGFQDEPGMFSLVAYGLLPLTWVVLLWGHGAYDRRFLGVGTDEYKRVGRTSWTVMALLAFGALVFKQDVSRLAVGWVMVAGLAYILLVRYMLRRVLYTLRARGYAIHRLLLVGTLPESLEVHNAITRNRNAGMIPVAIHLSEGYGASHDVPVPVPVFAGRDIVSLVREMHADTIAVCGAASAEPAELRRLAWQLEGTGVDLVVAPQLTDIAGPRVHIRPVEGLPLLHVEEPTLSGVAWLVKNIMDRVIALIGLMLLLPFFPIVAIAIKLSDRGPIFFRQSRVGREGARFKVWKLRTMYVDAEDRLASLVDQNESDGLLFKIKDDPRIFKVGKFLRATSIDELPQLINVLLGDMSLVGPRPLPADDGDFLGDVRRRLLVRPGITGLWQVSGRSDLSWDDAVRLDLYYVDNWSLLLDLMTMWRTVGAVLRSKGAY